MSTISPGHSNVTGCALVPLAQPGDPNGLWETPVESKLGFKFSLVSWSLLLCSSASLLLQQTRREGMGKGGCQLRRAGRTSAKNLWL